MVKFSNYLSKWVLLTILLLGAFIGKAFAQPSGTISIADFDAVGDGVADDSQALNDAISTVAADDSLNGVYFPANTYKISGSVSLKKGVSLYGDDSGVSLIKSDSLAKIGESNKLLMNVNDINIEDLFFLNVKIDFNCKSQNNRKNINFLRCVFAANKSSFTNSTEIISLSRVSESSIKNCIFLKQVPALGGTVFSWRSKDLVIEDNIFGLSFADFGWVQSQWNGANQWNNLSQRLLAFQSQENLSDDQGHFRRAVKVQRSEGLVEVKKNIVNGSNTYIDSRDHVMYIHNNYNEVVVTQNWMRGWENNSHGGLKEIILVR